jgi:hypothetical protein
MRCRDDVAAGRSYSQGPAGPGAGGGRWRHGAAPGGAAVPGERVVHLQGADPQAHHWRQRPEMTPSGGLTLRFEPALRGLVGDQRRRERLRSNPAR